jgi:CubicO group peptidase (beta-lactamase class C family)
MILHKGTATIRKTTSERILAYKIFAFVGLLGLLPVIVHSQGNASRIDALMHMLAERGQFNGSILVSESGRVIYQNGFGTADAAKGVAFTSDTPCYLASLTKQFTAMAVMMLGERHKLSYADALSKYFPQFPAYAQKITIRSLLNHTSGIPDYVGLGLEHEGLTDRDVLDALIKQSKPNFAAGEKFEYSNSGYILLALIIEKVSAQPYAMFLKRNIVQPLGMKSTFVRGPNTSLPQNAAHGYSRFGDDDDYTLFTYGEGGIYSTVRDLYKWDQASYKGRLVKSSTLQEAFTSTKLNDGTASNYGFGWGIAMVNGEPVVSHAGRFGGFNTYVKRFIKRNNAIIFLTNNDFRNMGAIGNAIINILDNKPYQLPKLSIADAMYKKYRSAGIASAITFYAEMKKKDDGTYDFSESELNELGYEIMGTNKFKDAIDILKLNAEAFPGSSNVYDGLGEAYMKNGDNDLAIENYKKSLELDPQNFNASAMLKKLAAH